MELNIWATLYVQVCKYGFWFSIFHLMISWTFVYLTYGGTGNRQKMRTFLVSELAIYNFELYINNN